MRLADFDYYLPPELIATKPAKKRDQSRLLVLAKKNGRLEHRHFFDLPRFLNKGDVLVLNNSKVIPARLLGKKSTGGEVEVLLNKDLGKTWECLIRGRVKVGTKIIFSKKLSGMVRELKEDGARLVKFNLAGTAFRRELEKIGHMPLPPYIVKRRSGIKDTKADRKDYQTIYAADAKAGSVAAPTAGLHFTPALLKKLKAQGVKIVFVTLNVGLGTFLPVKTENIKAHKLHSEYAELPQKTSKEILAAKKSGKRVVAVGTTTARTLEACFKHNKQGGFSGSVDLFIYPPYKFKVVDALITNFHLPKSSLLMLVSALAGKNNIDRAYQEAIKARYRFYSYGDAMLII